MTNTFFFRDYGITQEEILSVLSEAINLADYLNLKASPEVLEDAQEKAGFDTSLGDRAMEALAVLKTSWGMDSEA